MSTYSARAVLLRKTRLRDADLIFTLLFEDGSQGQGVARGILKPKAKMGGTLLLYSTVDLLLAKGKSIDVICEARAVEVSKGLDADLEKSAGAACVCELAWRLSLPEQPVPRLFDLVKASLLVIENSPRELSGVFVAAALLKMMSMCGYMPRLEVCVSCITPVEIKEEGNWFAWRDGGILCDRCASKVAGAIRIDCGVISWASALIRFTYAEIGNMCKGLLLRDDEGAGEAGCEKSSLSANTLCIAMLLFCRRWIEVHTGLSLKSLEFLIDIGTPPMFRK